MCIRYSAAISEMIRARMAEGQSLTRIARSPDLPHRTTLFRWMEEHEELAAAYKAALQARVDARYRARRRPKGCTPELADKICDLIIAGAPITSICLAPGMPSRASFFRWLRKDWKFSDQYARAKEIQADVMADEILEIADDPVMRARDKRAHLAVCKRVYAIMQPQKYKVRRRW